jgi:hypothetical protein
MKHEKRRNPSGYGASFFTMFKNCENAF